MIECRAEVAALPNATCRHDFRTTGINSYLNQLPAMRSRAFLLSIAAAALTTGVTQT
jgi:hypothetical protein